VALSPEDVEQPPQRGALKFLIRIGIGVAVIAVLVVRTPDRAALGRALGDADLGWAIGAALTLFVALGVSALRWQAYLAALEIDLNLATVVRLYFVGTFFNAFLPSGIGGDAYKAVRIGRPRGRLTEALASVFLDRFAGFVALAGLGLAGIVVELLQGDADLRVAQVAFVLSAAMLLAATALLIGGERLLGPRGLIGEHGIGGKLRGAVRAIHAAARHPAAAARGYAYGFVFQLLVLGYHLCIAQALGVHEPSVGAMTGVVVIASLATIIPLSPGGLGFREAAYAWALGSFGVSHDRALAFALVVLMVLLATSLAGGVVYIVRGGEVPTSAVPN
jgi:glycosyltransferase 2 family protein